MKVPGSTVRVTDVLTTAEHCTLLHFFLILTRFPSNPIDQRPPTSMKLSSCILALLPRRRVGVCADRVQGWPITTAATTSLSAVVTGPDGKAASSHDEDLKLTFDIIMGNMAGEDEIGLPAATDAAEAAGA